MVVEARGSVERAAATAVDCHWAGRFLSVVSLEFFQMREQFLVVGPAVQVIADHFAGSLGRLAASPQADHHPREKGIAVGTTVTGRPPHRSVREELPHTAPPSGQTITKRVSLPVVIAVPCE